MLDRTTWLDHWRVIQAEEDRLLGDMSAADSLRAYSLLCEAYLPRFRAEEASYLPEREAALIQRQRRLVRLAEWLASGSG